ncbi:MAG TPA: hypothetical protein VKX25_10455 [Bryobacteraceae bacterium]|jgi:hypothetical protein|nr:hypothetical protein [Bryobacteraceae bacterium]
MIRCAAALVLLFLYAGAANWRPANEAELKEVIPARAPVGSERIETEFRTASGITDGKGRYIAGVVLITAGYSADGKYSHFLVVQAPMKIADFVLKPGNYVFGWRHEDDGLRVMFYEAQSGKLLGTVDAVRNSTIGKIESFHLFPPNEKSVIQIGRFAFPYKIAE